MKIMVIRNIQNTGKPRTGTVRGCFVTTTFYSFKVRIHIFPGRFRKTHTKAVLGKLRNIYPKCFLDTYNSISLKECLLFALLLFAWKLLRFLTALLDTAGWERRELCCSPACAPTLWWQQEGLW